MSIKKLNYLGQEIKRFNGLMLGASIVMFMILLITTNYANSQVLERNDLSKQLKMAEDELRLVNATVSELQATQRIESESQRLNLVKVQNSDIFYIDDSRDTVALK